jgi:hypothetical protein
MFDPVRSLAIGAGAIAIGGMEMLSAATGFLPMAVPFGTSVV